MFRFLFILLGLFTLNVRASEAFMPQYLDDEEYFRCVRATKDYDDCSAQQMKRNLETVKKQYRVIISNPNLVGWHNEISENTATLRDMYESWTAFRTRICSLSVKASMYLEKLFDEKTSCNSYYVLHHKDHLDKIILLLTGNLPKNRNDFSYLEIYDHDEEYENCMKGKDTSKCLEEELKRSTKRIKDLYKTASEDKMIGKWNNGPDLKNGNYRDMYDSWIAYRNRMCLLSVWAYRKGYGNRGVNLTQCLQFFNREKLETMENLLLSAYSILDEEMVADTVDDGGEAEGKTIKPLQRRFDTKQRQEDALLDEETGKKPEVQKPADKEKSQQKKVNVPTWAQ